MKVEKGEKEWFGVFERVLRCGASFPVGSVARTGGGGFGSGVFGKVDSSYKVRFFFRISTPRHMEC